MKKNMSNTLYLAVGHRVRAVLKDGSVIEGKSDFFESGTDSDDGFASILIYTDETKENGLFVSESDIKSIEILD